MIDEAGEAARGLIAQHGGLIWKSIIEVGGYVPRIMHHLRAVDYDWHQMLPAELFNDVHIRKSGGPILDIRSLMREGISGAPRKRAWPAALETHALVHDDGHVISVPFA
jgi:hypothetical protein